MTSNDYLGRSTILVNRLKQHLTIPGIVATALLLGIIAVTTLFVQGAAIAWQVFAMGIGIAGAFFCFSVFVVPVILSVLGRLLWATVVALVRRWKELAICGLILSGHVPLIVLGFIGALHVLVVTPIVRAIHETRISRPPQ